MDERREEYKISTQRDHDLLIRMDTNMDNLKNQINEHIKEVDKQFADQNTRIALLERAYWTSIGILAMVNIIFGVITALVTKFFYVH